MVNSYPRKVREWRATGEEPSERINTLSFEILDSPFHLRKKTTNLNGHSLHDPHLTREFVAFICRAYSCFNPVMPNGTLGEALPRLKSPTKASKIVIGIVFGMRFIHSKGAIHYGLKPSNLFLDKFW
jgi:serine/threonine protein kinase